MRARVLSAALATACVAGAPAAAASQDDLLRALQRLNERIERLEQRNAELERALQSGGGQPGVERRLRALEDTHERISKGLDSENISDKEPELTSRLKAVEYRSLGMLKAARMVESLEGFSAGLSLTTVAQKPYGVPDSAPAHNSQLNYRGDVFVTLPLPAIGDTDNKIFAQLRLGQGTGLNAMRSYSKPNATAFRVLSTQPDDSVAVLGQAWYQAAIPLPLGGFK